MSDLAAPRPMPATPGEAASHLIAYHGWPVDQTVDNAGLLQTAHLNAHGHGRPELADQTLTHTHPFAPANPPGARQKTFWTLVATFVAVAGLGYGLTVAIQGGASADNDAASATTSSTWKPTPNLVDAPIGSALGGYVESRDSDSLHLDIPGSSVSGVEANLREVLDYLGFNGSAVVARMGQTRALDGIQSAEGRYATIHWNYHPKSGLDMVVESTGSN